MLCYLMVSHCNPKAFNLRISSFIVAFLRNRRWVVHYASMQFRHLVYKHKRNQEGLAPGPPRGGAGEDNDPGSMDFRGRIGFRKAVGFSGPSRGPMSFRGGPSYWHWVSRIIVLNAWYMIICCILMRTWLIYCFCRFFWFRIFWIIPF